MPYRSLVEDKFTFSLAKVAMNFPKVQVTDNSREAADRLPVVKGSQEKILYHLDDVMRTQWFAHLEHYVLVDKTHNIKNAFCTKFTVISKKYYDALISRLQ